MPLLPEWNEQDAIQLSWPHPNSGWKPWLPQAQQLYISICQQITQYQKVVLVCDPSVDINQVSTQLQEAGVNMANAILKSIPTNDTWTRDYGPITIQEQDALRILDFQFNAWGSKYAYDKDNQVSSILKNEQVFAPQLQSVDLVLEGGSIEYDGHGTLMTTANCLLNPNRNPALDKQQIADKLTTLFELKKIIWLQDGHLEGDDTDAHIDTLARFGPGRVLIYVQCQDINDTHYEALSAMEAELKAATDANGQAYKLVPLPMVPAIYADDGQRLPATYANFLITNRQILVPVYGQSTDEDALNVFKATFPDYDIVGLDCRVLIEQYGSLHCISMQLPAGTIYTG